MKNIIFILMLVAMVWSIFWHVGYFGMSDLSPFDQKLYIITTNLKYITVILFYIAWRVTPSSKQ
jgi:hypothetical protein